MVDEPGTTEILDEAPRERLSNSARVKIRKLNLLGDYELLGRNLRVIVASILSGQGERMY